MKLCHWFVTGLRNNQVAVGRRDQADGGEEEVDAVRSDRNNENGEDLNDQENGGTSRAKYHPRGESFDLLKVK